MKITICFMTGRKDSRVRWLIEDLHDQVRHGDEVDFIIIDALKTVRSLGTADPKVRTELEKPVSTFVGFSYADFRPILDTPWLPSIRVAEPKPNIWQGKHRRLPVDWWATANARNTAIVLAQTDYIVFIDDRSHLGPEWLAEVRRGYQTREAVLCGAYDKIEGTPPDIKRSVDHRLGISPDGNINCGGGWCYGCTIALPLEWCFEVNGFEEGCDGLTGEDYTFGMMLGNNGRRIDYCPKLMVHQDRTAGNETCKGSYRCVDKGVSPNDKSHAALERFCKAKRTEFTPDLRQLRADLASGKPFPVPDPNAVFTDWYDGEVIDAKYPRPM